MHSSSLSKANVAGTIVAYGPRAVGACNTQVSGIYLSIDSHARQGLHEPSGYPEGRNGRIRSPAGHRIKRAFEKQLDTSRYDIEMDDGEDVFVKKDLAEPVSALELVSSTARTVRLRVRSE
jgi:hypothetical protein